MLTTCPECQTTFRLGQAQLEARRGLVRCGQCNVVFNAYDALKPELDAPPAADEARGGADSVVVEDTTHSSPGPAEVIQPDPGSEQVTEQDTKQGSALDTEGAEAVGTFSPPDDDALGTRLDAETVEDTVTLSPASAVPPWPVEPPPPRQAFPPRPMPSPDSPDAILLSDLPTRRALPSGVRWLQGGALVLLAVIFLILLPLQAAYFLRGTLVQTTPELRPALERFCRALACEVPNTRDVTAIRIEASSLETDPELASHAQLRVTLGNRSTQPADWPVLLLKLTDTHNQAIAQKAFQPASYLPADVDERSGFEALGELEIALDLEIGALSAAGYEVRPYYP